MDQISDEAFSSSIQDGMFIHHSFVRGMETMMKLERNGQKEKTMNNFLPHLMNE